MDDEKQLKKSFFLVREKSFIEPRTHGDSLGV